MDLYHEIYCIVLYSRNGNARLILVVDSQYQQSQAVMSFSEGLRKFIGHLIDTRRRDATESSSRSALLISNPQAFSQPFDSPSC